MSDFRLFTTSLFTVLTKNAAVDGGAPSSAPSTSVSMQGIPGSVRENGLELPGRCFIRVKCDRLLQGANKGAPSSLTVVVVAGLF
jgi:hypothetical protein